MSHSTPRTPRAGIPSQAEFERLADGLRTVAAAMLEAGVATLEIGPMRIELAERTTQAVQSAAPAPKGPPEDPAAMAYAHTGLAPVDIRKLREEPP